MSQTLVSRGTLGVISGTVFIELCLWVVRKMRPGSVSLEAGKPGLLVVDLTHFMEYNRNIELGTYYTGFSGVSYRIHFLVVAFLAECF